MTDRSLGEFTPEEIEEHLKLAAQWVRDYFQNIEEYSVLPKVRPGEFAASLPSSPPDDGEPMPVILDDFANWIPEAMTHWNHPSFFAWFANSGSGPGIVAETLIAALNNNAMLWRSGPAAVELEQVVCDWLRQMLGLPEGFDGHINDTASVGTLVALAAARERLTEGKVREEGLYDRLPLRIYCSREAHSSVEKAAIVLGLGQQNVVKIPTDSKFQMRPDALMGIAMQDRSQGKVPCAVVATVGTTATTSVDPVSTIASICRREKMWLHVDAAYGGAMAVCKEYRWVLKGCEAADSLVINPHKWLFTPMDCSVLYTRDPEALRAAFSLVPSYLMTPEDDHARNLMDYGPALGRRFRALKLWFVLRAYGSKGIAARVKHHVELAARLQEWIADTQDWEQLAPAPMSVVLFRHHPSGMDDEDELRTHNEQILERVNATGECFLSHTLVGEHYALRLAIGNIRTEERHLAAAWRQLESAAAQAE